VGIWMFDGKSGQRVTREVLDCEFRGKLRARVIPRACRKNQRRVGKNVGPPNDGRTAALPKKLIYIGGV